MLTDQCPGPLSLYEHILHFPHALDDGDLATPLPQNGRQAFASALSSDHRTFKHLYAAVHLS